MSELAWKSNSPLYDALDVRGSVPSYKDVAANPERQGSSATRNLTPISRQGSSILNSPLSRLQNRHTMACNMARRKLFQTTDQAQNQSVRIAPRPQASGSGGGVTVQLISKEIKRKLSLSSAQSLASLDSPMEVSTEARAPTASTVVSASKAAPLSSAEGRQLVPTAPPIPVVTITPAAAGVVSQVTSTAAMTTPPKGLPPHVKRQIGLSAPSKTQPREARTPTSSAPVRLRRTTPLALFYRKVYNLAYLRIKDLCERLDQPPEFIQR